MFVLIKLFNEILLTVGKNQSALRRVFILPFVYLWYMIKVKLLIKMYIDRPNDILDFRSLIIEYVNFLTVMKNLPPAQGDINNIIRYDNSKITVIYDEYNNAKSIDYYFKKSSVYSDISIKVTVNENKLLYIELATEHGSTSFSYNSLIDARLIGVKDNIERIVRTDIAANTEYILLHKWRR